MCTCLSSCVFAWQEDRQRVLPTSNQLCEESLTMPLDLDSSQGPQRQHFHTHTAYSIQHTGFVPTSSNSFHCGGVTASQAEICCPPLLNPGRKQMSDRAKGFFFFCTNYLMCDLGACLPVMHSLWFIPSFNLSSNLFATAEPVSQQ